MAEISTRALVIAIQAIDREVRELREVVASDDCEPEDMQQLEDWRRAAAELEDSYDAVARVELNLPPYDELVKR